jgi:hypothetical protein
MGRAAGVPFAVRHPRAAAVAAVCGRLGVRDLVSYGAGGGVFEVALGLAAPELRLSVTDFGPQSVERLRGLFGEAHEHDLRADAPLPADLHLLYRVDTEFGDRVWRRVLDRFGTTLFVPGGLGSTRSVIRQAMRGALRRQPRVGSLRNEAAMVSLWSRSHTWERLPVGDLTGFLLHPRLGDGRSPRRVRLC